jgi:hypothetical protein
MENFKKIYLCKLIPNSNPRTYEAPVEFTLRNNYLTLMPKSDYTSVVMYGMDVDKYWNLNANALMFKNTFHEHDLMYVDGAYPHNDEDYYGEGANGEITSVLFFAKTIQITIKKGKLND